MLDSKLGLVISFMLALAASSILRPFGEEGKERSEPAQGSQQAPQRKQMGRILLSAELRIMDGEEAKEKLPHSIILIDPESGEWKDLNTGYALDPRLSPDGKTIAFGDWKG